MKYIALILFCVGVLYAQNNTDPVVTSIRTTNQIIEGSIAPSALDALIANARAIEAERLSNNVAFMALVAAKDREIARLLKAANDGPQIPLPQYIPEGLFIRTIGEELWLIRAKPGFALIPSVSTNGIMGEVFLKRK